MMIVARDSLPRGGVVVNPARTAAEAHVARVGNDAPVHDSVVCIHRVKARAHVHHRGVVGKDSAAPFAAGKADAAVAEAVVHPAVVAHVRSPVAFMEDVLAVFPAPVVGRPQHAGLGRGNPCAGNPVVAAVVAVRPITGRPHQARFRAERLLIDRHRRRRKPHADDNLSVRRRRDDREKKRQQEPAPKAKLLHVKTLPILSCLTRPGNRLASRRVRAWCGYSILTAIAGTG